MSRQIETATAIAQLQIVTAGLGDRIDQGFAGLDRRFETFGTALEKLSAHLTEQDKTLTSLVESRDRSRKLVKWLGGVAATVVAAIVLIVLGLK